MIRSIPNVSAFLWTWYLNEPNANRPKMVAKTSPATSPNGMTTNRPASSTPAEAR